MTPPAWRLQDAKAQFSAVVEAAMQGEPQWVTRRGKSAVVVIAVAQYERLSQSERGEAGGFIQHLLAMPRGRARVVTSKLASTAPATLKLRDVEFR